MRKTTIAAALGAILGVAIAGAAVANAPAPSFDKIDANHDGKLSKSEASKVEGLDFAKADKDSDGTLTRAEYEAAVG